MPSINLAFMPLNHLLGRVSLLKVSISSGCITAALPVGTSSAGWHSHGLAGRQLRPWLARLQKLCVFRSMSDTPMPTCRRVAWGVLMETGSLEVLQTLTSCCVSL